MSYVPKEKLIGTEDPDISFYTSTFSFTTANLSIDTRTQHYAYAKRMTIVNEDPTNSLQYRQGAADARLKTVPPNSEAQIVGWESFLQIIPNVATGVGFVEMDLVNLDQAFKK